MKKVLLSLLLLAGSAGLCGVDGYTWSIDGSIHNHGKDTASINYTDVRTLNNPPFEKCIKYTITNNTTFGSVYTNIPVTTGNYRFEYYFYQPRDIDTQHMRAKIYKDIAFNSFWGSVFYTDNTKYYWQRGMVDATITRNDTVRLTVGLESSTQNTYFYFIPVRFFNKDTGEEISIPAITKIATSATGNWAPSNSGTANYEALPYFPEIQPFNVVGGYAGRFDGLSNSVTLNANPNHKFIASIDDVYVNVNTNNNFSVWDSSFKPGFWYAASPTTLNYIERDGNAVHFVSDSTSIDISRSCLNVGSLYKIDINVISVVSGGIQIINSPAIRLVAEITSVGRSSFWIRAVSTNLQIKRKAGVSCNVTFTDVYINTCNYLANINNGAIVLGRYKDGSFPDVYYSTGDIKQFITHDGVLPTADLIAIQNDFSLAYRNPAYAEHCDLWYWTSGNYVNQKGYYTAVNNGVTNVATQNPLAISLGAENRGWLLNGKDQYIVMSTANYGDAGTNATWVFGYTSKETTDGGFLYSKRNNAVGEFSFQINGVSSGFNIYKGNALVGGITYSGLNDGKFKTVIVTYANPTFNIYVDGVLIGSRATDNSGIDGSIPSMIGFGSQGVGTAVFLNAIINYARKYPYVFDYAKISNKHNELRRKFYKVPVSSL